MKGSANIIVVAIIALLIGGFSGYAIKGTTGESVEKAMKSGDSMEKMEIDTSAAAGLRSGLQSLLTEHVSLALDATRAGYDGNAEFEQLAGALDNNSVAIAGAIGSVYGAEAEETFLAAWRSHIQNFVDYTVATKKGDKAGQDQAVADLQGYVETASTFLSGANPNLPKDALAEGLTTHITQLKNSVDAYAAGNYSEAFALQSEARTHMVGTANVLADAIVAQFPENFK